MLQQDKAITSLSTGSAELRDAQSLVWRSGWREPGSQPGKCCSCFFVDSCFIGDQWTVQSQDVAGKEGRSTCSVNAGCLISRSPGK